MGGQGFEVGGLLTGLQMKSFLSRPGQNQVRLDFRAEKQPFEQPDAVNGSTRA